MPTKLHRPTALALAAVLGAAVVTAPARTARADNVSPTGKGIVGGGLLGGEVVWIVEGVAGVHSGLVYAVSGVAGVGAGAVGGFFVEKGSNDGKAPMYLLAGGLALVIPAVVLMLNGTRFQPEEGAAEDRTPVGPPAEPGTPGANVTGAPNVGPAATPPPVEPAPPPPPPPANGTPGPTSLLHVREGQLKLGVPAVDVKPTFSVAETMQYGLRSQGTELRLPVLHVTF